jgi:hypothetical protein
VDGKPSVPVRFVYHFGLLIFENVCNDWYVDGLKVESVQWIGSLFFTVAVFAVDKFSRYLGREMQESFRETQLSLKTLLS